MNTYAILALAITGLGTSLVDGLQLVRVEETPGVEQRVVLGETEAAPEGATVKYALRVCGDTWFIRQGAWPFDGESVSEATLFGDQADALHALTVHCRDNGTAYMSAEVLRIALIPGAPSITETVLS